MKVLERTQTGKWIKEDKKKREHLSRLGVCNHSVTSLLAARDWYSGKEVLQLSHSPLIQFLQTHVLKWARDATSTTKATGKPPDIYLPHCQIFFTTGSGMTAMTDYRGQRKGSVLYWRRNPQEALVLAVSQAPPLAFPYLLKYFSNARLQLGKAAFGGIFFCFKTSQQAINWPELLHSQHPQQSY